MAAHPTPMRRIAMAVMLAASAAALGACSSGLPRNADVQRISDTPIEERSQDIRRTRQEAVNFLSEPATTVLETSGSNAIRLTVDAGQRVPDVPVGEINAQGMAFGSLLNKISEQVGMSWRINGARKEELLEKPVYFVQRSETTLRLVLDELATLTESFYKVEGDRIIFSQDQLFVLRVPRMANSQEVLADGLGNVGVTELFSDSLSGTISFRATKRAFESARRLISSFEQGRDMIVYDFWIIDRDVSDETRVAAGLGAGRGEWMAGAGELEEVESIDGASFSGSLGSLTVAAGIEFVRKLGNLNTVARPTISMLSGGESSFNSTLTEGYISSISEQTTVSDEVDGDEETEARRTQEVDTVEVGVKINVGGSHHGNVISTQFDLEVSELLGFTEGSDGTKQPRVSMRNLQAHLEARPGDVMIIAGIMRDRQQDHVSEIPGTRLSTSRARTAGKTETIILVRPRLVQIRPEGGRAPGAARVEPGVGSGGRAANPVADVMSDEAKARRILDDL